LPVASPAPRKRRISRRSDLDVDGWFVIAGFIPADRCPVFALGIAVVRTSRRVPGTALMLVAFTPAGQAMGR